MPRPVGRVLSAVGRGGGGKPPKPGAVPGPLGPPTTHPCAQAAHARPHCVRCCRGGGRLGREAPWHPALLTVPLGPRQPGPEQNRSRSVIVRRATFLCDPTVRRARQKPVSRGNVGSACPRGHSSLHPVRTGVGVGGGGVGVCLLPWEVNSCFTHRGTFKSVLESSRTPWRYAGDRSKWQASRWLSSWSTSSLWSPELWHSDLPSETVSRPRRQVFCSARRPRRPGIPGGPASGRASAPGPVRFLAASLCCRNPVATRVPSSPSGTSSVLRPFTWSQALFTRQ